MSEPRYLRPSKSQNVFHGAVKWLTARGVSLAGSRVLYLRGRNSGEWRTNPVNLLRFDGERYLVAPRGHTQWVRNLRASGEGRLRLGRRFEDFTAVELSDDEKLPVLRRYLEKWGWEVGAFFENLNAKSSDDEIRAVAADFPAFRVR